MSIPTGAMETGPNSKRNYDPEKIGIPFETRTVDELKMTVEGVRHVEQHLERFTANPAVEEMCRRLRIIAACKMLPTVYDLNFYAHELRERERYHALGWANGAPADPDAAHKLWNNVHTAALEEYGIQDERKELFHPDAQIIMQEFEGGWNNG